MVGERHGEISQCVGIFRRLVSYCLFFVCILNRLDSARFVRVNTIIRVSYLSVYGECHGFFRVHFLSYQTH